MSTLTKQAAYTQTEEQVLSSVQSTKEGLTSDQAKERLEKYGLNALQAGEKTTFNCKNSLISLKTS